MRERIGVRSLNEPAHEPVKEYKPKYQVNRCIEQGFNSSGGLVLPKNDCYGPDPCNHRDRSTVMEDQSRRGCQRGDECGHWQDDRLIPSLYCKRRIRMPDYEFSTSLARTPVLLA